ncbi:MAG: NAD-dependent epimerase/dehydratase family protein, partial [Limisphaerales bacterium]
MKVLLTGASGFVGSHVVEQLLAGGVPTVVLLRATSNRRFLEPLLNRLTVAPGSLDQPETLGPALEGVTHVIHCAGVVKAVRAAEFYVANRDGTRNLVRAVNSLGDQIQRFVHISSLAVSGLGTAADPAREDSPPNPVSEYGRSKLAAEQEVITGCRVPFTILRPGGVYGPRDTEFLTLFKAAAYPVIPVFAGGGQELSLVFAPDLARVVVGCLTTSAASGLRCHVASPEVVTARRLIEEIARAYGGRARILPLPHGLLRVVCGVAATTARWTGRATILAHGKRHELTAPGW